MKLDPSLGHQARAVAVAINQAANELKAKRVAAEAAHAAEPLHCPPRRRRSPAPTRSPSSRSSPSCTAPERSPTRSSRRPRRAYSPLLDLVWWIAAHDLVHDLDELLTRWVAWSHGAHRASSRCCFLLNPVAPACLDYSLCLEGVARVRVARLRATLPRFVHRRSERTHEPARQHSSFAEKQECHPERLLVVRGNNAGGLHCR